MTIELPDSVRENTTKCEHEFGCLATGRCGTREMCKVTGSFGPDVLLLATREQSSCEYRVSFGEGQLCTCPVRKYLLDLRYSGPTLN